MTVDTLQLETKFLAIVGDAPQSLGELLKDWSPDLLKNWKPDEVWKGPSQSEWRRGGLTWRFDPGDEIARLAAVARTGCGEARQWGDVVELAQFAAVELGYHADKQARELRAGRSTDDASGDDELVITFGDDEDDSAWLNADAIIALHGPASVLASGMLWSVQNPAPKAATERPMPGPDAMTGAHVLSAFALLMIDHAAYETNGGHVPSRWSF